MENIFKVKTPAEGETFDNLLKHKNIKIERTVSSDIIPDKIYRQAQDEWVLLLKGMAKIDITGQIVNLKAGDYIFIPAKQKHRVLKTKAGTIWLAIHIF